MFKKRKVVPRPFTTGETAEQFYEEVVESLGLSSGQVRGQSVEELTSSLALIEELLTRGDTVGSVKQTHPPNGTSSALTIERGVTPFLLRRRREIEQALEATAPPISFKGPGLDAAVKASGLIGAAFFAILYLSYNKFYSTIGVQPEDVGVNYAFVLARCLGLAVAVLLAVGLTAYAGFLEDLFSKVRGTEKKHVPSRAELIFSLLVYVGSVIGVSLLWIQDDLSPPWFRNAVTGWVAASLIWILTLLRRRRMFETRTLYILFSAALTFGYAVGLATYSGMKADEVLTGRAVGPAVVLGVPLWDIDAPYVTVQWIGPSGQGPVEFRKKPLSCVIRVGRNATTTYLIVPGGTSNAVTHRLLEVPAAMVAMDKSFPQSSC